MEKQYEYIEREFFVSHTELVGIFNNDYGYYGYQVVNIIPVLALDGSGDINHYHVIFMKDFNNEQD